MTFKIISKKGELTHDEVLAFIDYFNLCAEEWIFREAGYIYDRVWKSWEAGMRHTLKTQEYIHYGKLRAEQDRITLIYRNVRINKKRLFYSVKNNW